jgi:hypothetical protein
MTYQNEKAFIKVGSIAAAAGLLASNRTMNGKPIETKPSK